MEHSATTSGTNLLRTLSDQMADAVERISPALVLVNGRGRQPASGVIYQQHLVLTANHVLERDNDITIKTSDARTLPAKLVGRDSMTDLAVLRVADLGLDAAAPSDEAARVGQLVMTVGRPGNDGPMASAGIVSASGGPLRTERGTALARYIRTDATPYPGFSGGPLIDMRGAVLGILTTGLVNGAPFVIPIDIAKNIADTLVKHGAIKRGYLGISSQLVQLSDEQRAGRKQEHGLRILHVDEQSPASRGGVLVGDILLSIDNHDIRDSEDLQQVLTGDRVGKTVSVQVIRGNSLQTLSITIGQRT
ncbi:MAG: S1C family serine protease [Chloroflexota bacterium]|nr:S1C family serine protease [Chloroflexota bacterium]